MQPELEKITKTYILSQSVITTEEDIIVCSFINNTGTYRNYFTHSIIQHYMPNQIMLKMELFAYYKKVIFYKLLKTSKQPYHKILIAHYHRLQSNYLSILNISILLIQNVLAKIHSVHYYLYQNGEDSFIQQYPYRRVNRTIRVLLNHRIALQKHNDTPDTIFILFVHCSLALPKLLSNEFIEFQYQTNWYQKSNPMISVNSIVQPVTIICIIIQIFSQPGITTAIYYIVVTIIYNMRAGKLRDSCVEQVAVGA